MNIDGLDSMVTQRKADVFGTLNALNVNEHTEQKNVGGKDLTYLSWVWAWAEIKKRYPDAHYDIIRDARGLPYVYDPITGFMVFTTVTIEGITHMMWLAVMDGANNAMKAEPYSYKVKNPKFRYAKKQPDGRYLDSYGNEQQEFLIKNVDAATMTDINKTIMRCLVKNLAMFGLGLYIYAGEDLPEVEQEEQKQAQQTQSANVRPQNAAQQASVTKADVMPAPQPQAAKPAENAAAKIAKGPEPGAYETPGGYIRRRIAEITPFMMDGFNFVNARKSLIASGAIADIPSAVMTMDQAKDLIAAIEKNFRKPED